MILEVSPESAIRAVRFGVKLCRCWPPPSDATKTNLILRDILWLVMFLFPAHGAVETILTAYAVRNDPPKFTKIITEMAALINAAMKMIVCRAQRRRLRTGIEDLYEFTRMANEYDRKLLERCLGRCSPLYSLVGVAAVCETIIFCCAPIYMSQPFPSDIEYPAWGLEVPKIRASIYIYEVITICTVCSAVLVDLEIALLLWFSSVRFEILGEEFRKAGTTREFDECIKKHQNLIESAQEVTVPASHIAVILTAITILSTPCCAYQFVLKQPFAIKFRFFSLFFCTSVEVLLYAWPADHLMAKSGNIAWAAYCSPWTSSGTTSRKVYTVMIRAQKEIIIYIDGVLPILNLDFYGKFLTTALSYLTTLRAVTT